MSCGRYGTTSFPSGNSTHFHRRTRLARVPENSPARAKTTRTNISAATAQGGRSRPTRGRRKTRNQTIQKRRCRSGNKPKMARTSVPKTHRGYLVGHPVIRGSWRFIGARLTERGVEIKKREEGG